MTRLPRPLKMLVPALAAALLCGFAAAPAAAAPEAEEGFTPLFDGKTLDGWDGDPRFWSVEDGSITGRTTDENPTKGNTFLLWKEPVANFELRLDYKIVAGNSGIQYRSARVDPQSWVIGGYQADIDSGDTFSGILYDERGRGILAGRGQKTAVGEDGKPQVVEQFAESAELQKQVHKEEWNSYRIVADGFTFTHQINGQTMCVCEDNDTDAREATGLLALQLHAGPPMTVMFKNVRIQELEQTVGEGSAAIRRLKAKPKMDVKKEAMKLQQANPVVRGGDKLRDVEKDRIRKVVFVAGRPSHGYGQHEHQAGCLLLAESLKASGLPVTTEVVTGGWPKDESVFDGADAVVIYADGGGGHPAIGHLDTLRTLSDRGCGIVCLHYGVEVPKGEPGDALLDVLGGYFETDWSVNPHWTADFGMATDSPITRGVKPFAINDEWYYHMRFREGMEYVTPVLGDVPPDSTLSRPDGPHSGNPAVRKAVANREMQPVAWASERPDAGRGFGFTGGHYHWNWGHNQFRKLVLNAIVWSAHVEVPQKGVTVRTLSVAELEANQDESTPGNHNSARLQAQLDEWNR